MRIDLRMKPQRPKSASQFWRKTRRTSPLILSWAERPRRRTRAPAPAIFQLGSTSAQGAVSVEPNRWVAVKAEAARATARTQAKKESAKSSGNGFGPALLNLRRPFDSATNPQSLKRDAKSDAQWADRKNNSHDGAPSPARPNASRINILPLSPGFEQFSLVVSHRANSSPAVKLNLAKLSQAKLSSFRPNIGMAGAKSGNKRAKYNDRASNQTCR